MLLDTQGADSFDAVVSFTASDASGTFGLLAGHERLVAVMRYGLAHFVAADGRTHYVALPGGVLRFADNALTVTAVHYFLGAERDTLVAQLAAELAREDSDLRAAHATLAEIEHILMRRLSELGAPVPGGAS